MKLDLLSGVAAMSVVAGIAPAALAQDQAGAGGQTAMSPSPTLQEELVYLRDRMSLQSDRLEQAEKLLQRQQTLIELQEAKIAQLERKLDDTTRLASALQQGRSYAATSTSSSGGAGGEYRVRRGDNLSRIAQRNNTTVRALAQANNLRSPYRLQIGQRLTIPGAPATARVAEASSTQQQQAAKAPANKVAQTQPKKSQPQPQRVAQNNQRGQQQNTPQRQPQRRDDNAPREVGQRPEEEEKAPDIEIASDIGGILTPKGSLFVEPTIEMTTSTDNRFFFRGIELVDAVLVGLIDATDSDRRAVSSRMGFRYGLTNRLELDGRVSYIYRDDRISGFEIDNQADVTVRDLEGTGFGDIDFGLHYQLNRGRKFPYTIANVRVNAPTGRGPFEIERTAQGQETELATGSGYWSIEPSLTFILPTDPAVIFANVGYLYNMPVQPNEVVGPNITVREFDAGDAIKTSLGIGLSVNDRMSLSFGYDQSYFLKSRTVLDVLDPNTMDVTTNENEQPSAVIGSFLFGGSYRVDQRTSINLNTSFGATDGAPDMRVSLRARVKLFD